MSPALHEPTMGGLSSDSRALLTGALTASAITQADRTFAEVHGFAAAGVGSPTDLAAHIEARGKALTDLWADLMALAGLDREPWAREAALRAVRAYADRLGELMAASAEGGRS